MRTIWTFLKAKRNREMLGWAGGGLVAVAAGLWAVIVYLFPPMKPLSNAEANCGSVVIGGNVNQTGITVSNSITSNCSRPSK